MNRPPCGRPAVPWRAQKPDSSTLDYHRYAEYTGLPQNFVTPGGGSGSFFYHPITTSDDHTSQDPSMYTLDRSSSWNSSFPTVPVCQRGARLQLQSCSFSSNQQVNAMQANRSFSINQARRFTSNQQQVVVTPGQTGSLRVNHQATSINTMQANCRFSQARSFSSKQKREVTPVQTTCSSFNPCQQATSVNTMEANSSFSQVRSFSSNQLTAPVCTQGADQCSQPVSARSSNPVYTMQARSNNPVYTMQARINNPVSTIEATSRDQGQCCDMVSSTNDIATQFLQSSGYSIENHEPAATAIGRASKAGSSDDMLSLDELDLEQNPTLNVAINSPEIWNIMDTFESPDKDKREDGVSQGQCEIKNSPVVKTLKYTGNSSHKKIKNSNRRKAVANESQSQTQPDTVESLRCTKQRQPHNDRQHPETDIQRTLDLAKPVKQQQQQHMCCCPPDAAGEPVPMEQVFVRDGQMYRLLEANVIRIGINMEFYAFIKDEECYVALALFYRAVGPHLQPQFEAEIYQRLKTINFQTMGDNEQELLRQKCKLRAPPETQELINLVDLIMLIRSVAAKHPRNKVLAALAQAIVLQKVLETSSLRCSKCCLPCKIVSESDFVPLHIVTSGETKQIVSESDYDPKDVIPTSCETKSLSDTNHQLGDICEVGTLDVGSNMFVAYKRDDKLYVSIKEVVGCKLLVLSQLRSKMASLSFHPVLVPKEVEQQLALQSPHLCNTLWIEVVQLRCCLCMAKPHTARQARALLTGICSGDFTFTPKIMVACEPTVRSFTGGFFLNETTLHLEKTEKRIRSDVDLHSKLPFHIAKIPSLQSSNRSSTHKQPYDHMNRKLGRPKRASGQRGYTVALSPDTTTDVSVLMKPAYEASEVMLACDNLKRTCTRDEISCSEVSSQFTVMPVWRTDISSLAKETAPPPDANTVIAHTEDQQFEDGEFQTVSQEWRTETSEAKVTVPPADTETVTAHTEDGEFRAERQEWRADTSEAKETVPSPDTNTAIAHTEDQQFEDGEFQTVSQEWRTETSEAKETVPPADTETVTAHTEDQQFEDGKFETVSHEWRTETSQVGETVPPADTNTDIAYTEDPQSEACEFPTQPQEWRKDTSQARETVPSPDTNTDIDLVQSQLETHQLQTVDLLAEDPQFEADEFQTNPPVDETDTSVQDLETSSHNHAVPSPVPIQHVADEDVTTNKDNDELPLATTVPVTTQPQTYFIIDQNLSPEHFITQIAGEEDVKVVYSEECTPKAKPSEVTTPPQVVISGKEENTKTPPTLKTESPNVKIDTQRVRTESPKVRTESLRVRTESQAIKTQSPVLKTALKPGKYVISRDIVDDAADESFLKLLAFGKEVCTIEATSSCATSDRVASDSPSEQHSVPNSPKNVHVSTDVSQEATTTTGVPQKCVPVTSTEKQTTNPANQEVKDLEEIARNLKPGIYIVSSKLFDALPDTDEEESHEKEESVNHSVIKLEETIEDTLSVSDDKPTVDKNPESNASDELNNETLTLKPGKYIVSDNKKFCELISQKAVRLDSGQLAHFESDSGSDASEKGQNGELGNSANDLQQSLVSYTADTSVLCARHDPLLANTEGTDTEEMNVDLNQDVGKRDAEISPNGIHDRRSLGHQTPSLFTDNPSSESSLGLLPAASTPISARKSCTAARVDKWYEKIAPLNDSNSPDVSLQMLATIATAETDPEESEKDSEIDRSSMGVGVRRERNIFCNDERRAIGRTGGGMFQFSLTEEKKKALEEERAALEANMIKYLVVSVTRGNPPRFSVCRFKPGAEHVFPVLFYPDPNHPRILQKRKLFMAMAAKYLENKYHQHVQDHLSSRADYSQAENMPQNVTGKISNVTSSIITTSRRAGNERNERSNVAEQLRKKTVEHHKRVTKRRSENDLDNSVLDESVAKADETRQRVTTESVKSDPHQPVSSQSVEKADETSQRVTNKHAENNPDKSVFDKSVVTNDEHNERIPRRSTDSDPDRPMLNKSEEKTDESPPIVTTTSVRSDRDKHVSDEKSEHSERVTRRRTESETNTPVLNHSAEETSENLERVTKSNTESEPHKPLFNQPADKASKKHETVTKRSAESELNESVLDHSVQPAAKVDEIGDSKAKSGASKLDELSNEEASVKLHKPDSVLGSQVGKTRVLTLSGSSGKKCLRMSPRSTLRCQIARKRDMASIKKKGKSARTGDVKIKTLKPKRFSSGNNLSRLKKTTPEITDALTILETKVTSVGGRENINMDNVSKLRGNRPDSLIDQERTSVETSNTQASSVKRKACALNKRKPVKQDTSTVYQDSEVAVVVCKQSNDSPQKSDQKKVFAGSITDIAVASVSIKKGGDSHSQSGERSIGTDSIPHATVSTVSTKKGYSKYSLKYKKENLSFKRTSATKATSKAIVDATVVTDFAAKAIAKRKSNVISSGKSVPINVDKKITSNSEVPTVSSEKSRNSNVRFVKKDGDAKTSPDTEVTSDSRIKDKSKMQITTDSIVTKTASKNRSESRKLDQKAVGAEQTMKGNLVTIEKVSEPETPTAGNVGKGVKRKQPDTLPGVSQPVVHIKKLKFLDEAVSECANDRSKAGKASDT